MIIVAHFEQLSLSNCTFHLCEKHIWQATFISPCKVDTWYWHSGARTGHTDKRPGYIITITIINCCPSPLTILYPCSRWLFTSNATWNEEDREIISQNIFVLLQKITITFTKKIKHSASRIVHTWIIHQVRRQSLWQRWGLRYNFQQQKWEKFLLSTLLSSALFDYISRLSRRMNNLSLLRLKLFGSPYLDTFMMAPPTITHIYHFYPIATFTYGDTSCRTKKSLLSCLSRSENRSYTIIIEYWYQVSNFISTF